MEAEGSNHEQDSHCQDILSYIDKLKCDGMFCDVKIRAGDTEFGAHKVVLVAASEYFEAMFRSKLSESSSGIISFSEMTPEITRQCIEFIYSGKVDISTDNVADLLHASEMMALPRLSKRCVAFFSEKVDVDTCAYIISLSHRYGKEKLDLPLRNLLLERFDEVVLNEEFMDLENEALLYCLKLLHGGGSELEIQKWTAIILWVKHDFEMRYNFFPAFFETLDITLFSKKFTKDTVLEEPLVQNSRSCLLSIAKLHTDETIGSPPPCKRRTPMSHLVMCKPKEESQVIVKYDVTAREWSVIATFPGKLDELAHFITHDDRLYVGTGHKIYEYANNLWRSGCPTQDVNKMFRSCTGVCCCNFSCPVNKANFSYNRCIAINNSVLMLTADFMYELNIVTSKLYSHSVGVDLGQGFFITASTEKVYAFGGEGTELNAVEIDLKTKKRTRLCNMTYGKGTGHAFWHEAKAFAFGGDVYPASIECYLPNQDIWVTVRSAQVPRRPVQIHIGKTLCLIQDTSPVKIVNIQLYKLDRHTYPSSDPIKGTSFCCPSTS